MSSEKTEEPTPHKLRKAREEGQVPKSKDFTQTLLLGALFGYTIADSERLIRHMAQIIVMPSQLHGVEFRNAYGQAVDPSRSARPATKHQAGARLSAFRTKLIPPATFP